MKNNCMTKEQTFLCDSHYDIAIYKLKKEPRYDILRGLDLKELDAKAEEFRIAICKELMKLMASSAENGYSFGTLEEIAEKLGQDGFTSILHIQRPYKGKHGTGYVLQPIVVRNEYNQEIWLNIGPSMSQYFTKLAFEIFYECKRLDHESNRQRIEEYSNSMRFFQPKEKADERWYIYGYETDTSVVRHANYEVDRYWAEERGCAADYDDVDALLVQKKEHQECGDIIAVRKKDHHIIKTYFACEDGHYEEINDFVHDPIEHSVWIMENDADHEKRRIDNELYRQIRDLEEKTAKFHPCEYLFKECKEEQHGNYYICNDLEDLPF